MEQNKPTRGGRRKGAGRPKGNGKLFAFRSGEPLAGYIERHQNKTRFILRCIETVRQAEAQSEPDLTRLGSVYPADRVKPLTLPFFDLKVAAGFPIPLNNDELAQDIELLRLLCPHPEASYLIRVCGDSMIDADIYTDDILIVDKSNRNPGPKQVALCELNGEYTIKYVVLRQGKGWLVPANSRFPEIEITEDDEFRVWGTVTYVIHKPRG